MLDLSFCVCFSWVQCVLLPVVLDGVQSVLLTVMIHMSYRDVPQTLKVEHESEGRMQLQSKCSEYFAWFPVRNCSVMPKRVCIYVYICVHTFCRCICRGKAHAHCFPL